MTQLVKTLRVSHDALPLAHSELRAVGGAQVAQPPIIVRRDGDARVEAAECDVRVVNADEVRLQEVWGAAANRVCPIVETKAAGGLAWGGRRKLQPVGR